MGCPSPTSTTRADKTVERKRSRKQMKKQMTRRGKDKMRSLRPRQGSGKPYYDLRKPGRCKRGWRNCTRRRRRATSCWRTPSHYRRIRRKRWKKRRKGCRMLCKNRSESQMRWQTQSMELSDFGGEYDEEEEAAAKHVQFMNGAVSRWSTTALATICGVRVRRHNERSYGHRSHTAKCSEADGEECKEVQNEE